MKERASVLLGVLVAAWVFYGIFAPPPQQPLAVRPLSTANGPHGLQGLWRWLNSTGVPIESLREPFTVLTQESRQLDGPGHILITTMPQLRHPDRNELNTLLDWTSGGNTLLIVAALNDTPGWSYGGDAEFFIDDFHYLTGILPTVREADPGEETGETGAPAVIALQRLSKPLEHVANAVPDHWLTAEVGTLGARSDLPTSDWDLAIDPADPAFVLARTAETPVDALLLTPVGTGTMIISTYGSLLQNAMIGKYGNRQFIVNVLRHHLKPGGRVIIDDMHQGLSSVYDAQAFFRDPRLWRSLLLVLGFWLLYAVFADSRLGRLVPPAEPDAQTDFVRALGGFLARKVPPREAALRLLENFLTQVAPRLPPGNDGDAWERVGNTSRMDLNLARELRACHEQLKSGKTVKLEILQRRLSAARRAFS